MGQAADTVRSVYEAFGRQDWEGVLALFDPSLELDMTRSGMPDGGVYHGREGLQEGWAKWRGVWDRYDVELEELIEVGERVLALIHVRASSKGQGMDTEGHAGDVFTVRDGLIVHFAIFLDRDAARREVGLG
jgi:ketosteroid isomerase-like protein